MNTPLSEIPDAVLLDLVFSFPHAHGTGGSPFARQLLERCGSLAGILRSDQAWLSQQPGVGLRKGLRLQAVQELVHRASLIRMRQTSIFSETASIIDYLRERLQHQPRERFLVILLDAKHRLLQVQDLFRGSVDRVAVYPREVLRFALIHHATHFLVAHNHPSGDPAPSDEDLWVTEALMEAAETVGLTLLDHFIVAGSRVVSFAQEGWIAQPGGGGATPEFHLTPGSPEPN